MISDAQLSLFMSFLCHPPPPVSQVQAPLGSQLTSLREIQCLVCSYLHQTFIAEPSLVKLVHFQGYPAELLPMMVSGVPSVHICLDFIPELLSQSQAEKQVCVPVCMYYYVRMYVCSVHYLL